MESDTSASTTTSPTSSGSEGSSRRNAEQRLADLDALLEQYERSVGLPSFQFAKGEDDAQQYLDLTADQLRSMSDEDCGIAAVILRQFAHRLQRALNVETTRVRWCHETLRRMAAKYLPNVWGWGSEERLSQVFLLDEACKKVDDLRVKAQFRIERLNYLAGKVTDQANSLDKLQQTKRKWRD